MWCDELLSPGRGDRLPVVSRPVPARPSPAEPFRRGGPPVSAAQGNPWQWWWDFARAQARELLAGIVPPPVDVHGPVLSRGESAVVGAEVSYSRLYGGEQDWVPRDPVVLGRPSVMVVAAAIGAVVNHQRRAAARRDAAVRWRDGQSAVAAWATTHRILCNTARGLMSFHYGAVREFYPDPQRWSLVLGFDPEVAPVRLTGPAAPMLALWAAVGVLGDRWSSDPRLSPLLS